MRTLLPALVLAALMIAGTATAQQRHDAGLEVEDAWARPAASGNGAVYLKMANAGDAPDRLLAARATVAGAVELHTHEIDAAGVARMRQVQAIDVPAGGEVTLAPGGMHVMLVGLSRPLAKGSSFPLTLAFERAGEVAVEVRVGAGGGQGGHASH